MLKKKELRLEIPSLNLNTSNNVLCRYGRKCQ
jgi:hypothetical protein